MRTISAIFVCLLHAAGVVATAALAATPNIVPVLAGLSGIAVASETASELRVTRDPGAFATLNREFTWEFVWQPARAIAPGTRFQLRCRNLRTLSAWTYRGVELGGTAKASFESFAKPRSGDTITTVQTRGLALGEGTLSNGLRAGERVKVLLHAVPPYHADLEETLGIWLAAPSGSATKDAAPKWEKQENALAVLRIGPGPVERLAVYSRPTPGMDGQVRTVLSPEDRFGNAGAFRREVTLSLTWNGRTWAEKLQRGKIIQLPAPATDVGRLQVTVEARQLSLEDNIVNGRAEDGRISVRGNPVWRQSPTGKVGGFGEFHWHSELSGDGSGRLAYGMEIARDQLNMSYCMASDHWPKGNQWKEYVAVMDQFNQAGQFATMFGYEAGSAQGHENFYFVNADNPLNPDGALKICRLPPSEYQKQLDQSQRELGEDQKIIAIPHHTNTESESYRADGKPYWPAYQFSQPTETHRLIEVFQTRGNMERNEYTDVWRGWYAKGSSVQDALAAGYKLGFTGGTDNHCGRPGYCFGWVEMNRGRMPLHSQSLTGVWADRIDRRSVWKALYDRHTWAAWDTRALVHFEINGVVAGDELRLPLGSALQARVKISTEDSLQALEIISAGKTCWSASVDALDSDLTIDLGKAGQSTYFYLRGLQRNGGMFYASPVFVTIQP
jgi:hypothetical protein